MPHCRRATASSAAGCPGKPEARHRPLPRPHHSQNNSFHQSFHFPKSEASPKKSPTAQGSQPPHKAAPDLLRAPPAFSFYLLDNIIIIIRISFPHFRSPAKWPRPRSSPLRARGSSSTPPRTSSLTLLRWLRSRTSRRSASWETRWVLVRASALVRSWPPRRASRYAASRDAPP